MCSLDLLSKSVAAELCIHEHTVGKRSRRPDCLGTINDDQIPAVTERTLRTTLATQWSIYSMTEICFCQKSFKTDQVRR